jgi:hypothetical protein
MFFIPERGQAFLAVFVVPNEVCGEIGTGPALETNLPDGLFKSDQNGAKPTLSDAGIEIEIDVDRLTRQNLEGLRRRTNTLGCSFFKIEDVISEWQLQPIGSLGVGVDASNLVPPVLGQDDQREISALSRRCRCGLICIGEVHFVERQNLQMSFLQTRRNRFDGGLATDEQDTCPESERVSEKNDTPKKGRDTFSPIPSKLRNGFYGSVSCHTLRPWVAA